MSARFLLLRAVVLAAGVLASPLAADDHTPVVLMDLRVEGPGYDFGMWLLGALRDQELSVRWPEQDQAGQLSDRPACVVTWSDPQRSGDRQRYLRDLLQQGAGLVFVVGSGRAHVRSSRNSWGALDVDIQEAGGESGFATWGAHPITEGLPNIGAVDPQCYISGPGGTPLIRFGAQSLAAAFDWGPEGRAVILDQAILSSQLSTTSPRPALQQLVTRSILWAAGLWPPAAASAPATGVAPVTWDRPAPSQVGPMPGDRALVDIAADDGGWREIRLVVEGGLEKLGIGTRSLRGVEGGERLTPGNLASRGMVVVGSARADFTWAEALALRRYFDEGGRLLLLALDEPEPHARMIAFNRLLAELELAISLGRQKGRVELGEHEITRGLNLDPGPAGTLLEVGPGPQVWAWQVEPLVVVRGGVAAAALETDNSRLVIMDAGLLLPYRKRDPAPFVAMLENSIRWLTGR